MPRMMGPHGQRNNPTDSSKNFKSSIGKLIKYLKPYLIPIIVAVVLIIVSTVFTLMGPNRLSKVTGIVEKGISVSYTFSDEEFNSLKTTGTLHKDFSGMELEFNYNIINSNPDNYEYAITIILNGYTLGAVNSNDLGPNCAVELNNTEQIAGGLGISIIDDEFKLWINTQTKINVEEIFKICITLTILYLIGFTINTIQGIIMAIINQKVSKDLRKNLSAKINKLPLKYFDSTTYGDTLSRITNDADTIGQTLNHSVGSLIGSIALFVGTVIMMFVTNWIMAIAGILATVIGFAIMIIIIKKSQKYFIMQQQVLGKANGLIEEVYSGQEIIKSYNAEKETSMEFETINSSLYKSAWKSQFFSDLMRPLMSFIGNFGYVVVCVIGAVLVHYSVIGFAAIVAFMIYIRLFTQPLAQLAQSITGLQSTAAASERVFEFLELPEMSDQSHIIKRLDTVKGNVEFRHVKFGYLAEKTIINDFSAKIKAGQKVAIVGPTGAGKTTLVNLLMKFYEIDSGDIIIDGISIHELTRENIHDMFGMVLQDTWLFDGSVKDNIRYDKHAITDEQIVEACKACGLHHFIKTLPHGYDTVLNDNVSISAGQKQLLTIARAMIENAPLLILDEATSSVDTRTEILIQNAMDNLMRNRTSFVIAHRLSTIKNADLILVMKNGDIVESGHHNELLRQNGFYAELYNSQFEEK